jgi:integrase
MARMMDELGPRGRREWALLDAVRSGALSVGQLHDAYVGGAATLDALKAESKDVDVGPYVDPWLKSLSDYVAPDTIQHYGTHVRSLIPSNVRFPISHLKRSELAKWLNTIDRGPSTKRKYRAAMSRFCEYLISMELLASNPMLEVKAPKAAAPRMRYLGDSEIIRLVEAQDEPFRTISALMHATGMEISAVLRLSRGDVDARNWMVRAHGTKTAFRDRQAYVTELARSYLVRKISTLMPGVRLFEGVTGWAARNSHDSACQALGIADYTLRDSRHTFAVAAIKRGAPAKVVAAQLGHSTPQMVNQVYARFRPSQAEMAKWLGGAPAPRTRKMRSAK